jgi:hypothetical protein
MSQREKMNELNGFTPRADFTEYEDETTLDPTTTKTEGGFEEELLLAISETDEEERETREENFNETSTDTNYRKMKTLGKYSEFSEYNAAA